MTLSRAEICERKALIKQRFTITDARKMCTARPIPNGALYLCPCCRSDQTYATRTRHGRGFEVTNLRCKSCGFDGGPVSYVMAALSLGSTAAAITRIEHYLESEGDDGTQ